MITDKQYEEAFKNLHDYHKEIEDHNTSFLKQFGETANSDFAALVDGCTVTGKIEYVDNPRGTDQFDDDCGIFKDVHVDQWSVGDSGDSYGGFIYANVNGRWISIPYEC